MNYSTPWYAAINRLVGEVTAMEEEIDKGKKDLTVMYGKRYPKTSRVNL